VNSGGGQTRPGRSARAWPRLYSACCMTMTVLLALFMLVIASAQPSYATESRAASEVGAAAHTYDAPGNGARPTLRGSSLASIANQTIPRLRVALVAKPPSVSAYRTAAKSAEQLALPSGSKMGAQWGAGTYRHGGLMSTIEHISYRHSFNSGFANVSRFAQNTSARSIKGYVDEALRTGTLTDRGVIADLGRTIGTDQAGNAVSGIEVIVRDGLIKTAYPMAAP
jgi:hypothetical protein